MRKLIKEIRKLKGQDVLVLTHDSPDGDAMGSTVAMGWLLREAGARPLLVHKEAIPEKYRFLVGDLPLYALQDLSEEQKLREFTVFILDSASEERAGFPFREAFPRSGRVYNIDHHISNGNFGDENWVYPGKAATSEIVGDLYLEMFPPICPEAATALYTGVMTDTGNLTYQSTTSATVALVSILLDMGADFNTVRRRLHESETMNQMAGVRHILNEMKLAEDGYVVYTSLPYEVVKAHSLTSGDTENYVEYPRKVDTCEIAILFKEMEKDVIRVSIRTKGEIDANELAAAFGGGGHARAAGFRVSRPMEEARAYVLDRVEKGLAAHEWADRRL